MSQQTPLWTENSAVTDELVAAYFRQVSAEDLRLLGAEKQRDIVARHLQIAGSVDEHGASLGVDPAIGIFAVHPDQPYLVDSITTELVDHQHRPIDLLNHPVFIVHRSATDSSLKAVYDLPATAAGTRTSGETAELVSASALVAPVGLRASLESWISVRPVTPLPAEAAEPLTTALTDTLAQVRAVVADRDRMRTTALAAADRLRASAPAEVQRVEETAQLLEWMVRSSGFIFMGSRSYELDTNESGEQILTPQAGTGAGLLDEDRNIRGATTSPRPLSAAGRAQISKPVPLIATKTNARSHVQRGSYLDYVAVKTYDETGRVTGEQRFIGLWSTNFYADAVTEIPYLRRIAERVGELAGFTPGSHLDQQLKELVNSYNREDLLQIEPVELWGVLDEVLRLGQRRRTRLFVRTDTFGRFVTATVYLPRDRYNTSVRTRLQELLLERLNGESLDFGVQLTEIAHARLAFRIKLRAEASPDLLQDGLADLEQEVADTVRSWKESVDLEAVATLGDELGAEAAQNWDEAFPASYRVRYEVENALADIAIFDALADTGLHVDFLTDAGEKEQSRLKIYTDQEITLSELLPVLANLGLGVTDELPAVMTPADGRIFYLYDLGLTVPDSVQELSLDHIGPLIEESVGQTLTGANPSDTFNRLTTHHGISLLNVAILRAYALYLRQLAVPSSLELISATLLNYPETTAALLRLFGTKFDPTAFDETTAESTTGAAASPARREAVAAAEQDVLAQLESVASLDADRVLRAFLTVISATERTGAYLPAGASRISFKLDPTRISFAPEPRPRHEIWVHGPEVSGTHLRFGDVARGGLRWSDRSEDFRTEVLGLVDTQQLKNSVIVPAGAKGGFFPHRLPDPARDRDAWMAGGRSAYQQFICGLLDITDNQRTENGQTTVWTPARVIRHDAPDPYLVVAADKGTARFSDTANQISEDYGFWLGDAFASGGSVGYDHKAMGITARGAWESVRSHFAALGVDADQDPIRVIGIGDMSGDVFGNGMRRSEKMKLVAAFNHLHIFIDPDPDPETSFTERERLYHVPRSSWGDYNRELISAGGGVFDRHAKSIPLTDQIRDLFDLDADVQALSGDELVHALLQAPVDLIYNGGIGTYIKASTETHDQVGDRANDAIRIDGAQLRTRVVVEGGNLGATQAGRVEAAKVAGVRINTDAIDNSAGVDASDHEVNIKILVNDMVTAGLVPAEERAELLHELTDEVAELVLATNTTQNRLLRVEEKLSAVWTPAYARFIGWLEEHAGLDRAQQHIPAPETLTGSGARGPADLLPLQTPELAVLTAYAKISLVDQLATHPDAVADEWFHQILFDYFPPSLRERAGAQLMSAHSLADQILHTQVANHIINAGGLTAIFRAQEETGADIATQVRAFFVAEQIFGIPELSARIWALPAGEVDPALRIRLAQDLRRLTDRLLRWLIHHQLTSAPMAERINAFQQEITELTAQLPELLVGRMRQDYLDQRQTLRDGGIPAELADRLAGIFESYALLDIVEIARRTGKPLHDVARLFFYLQESFNTDQLLMACTKLSRRTHWEALARTSIREELYGFSSDLTVSVLNHVQNVAESKPDGAPLDVAWAVADWTAAHQRRVGRVRDFLAQLDEETELTLPVMTVVISRLKSLII